MGEVRFSCPPDLIAALARAGRIDAAVETGTFKAEGTLLLRGAVSQVWTIELSADLHDRALARHGQTAGITFLRGPSDRVLPELLASLDEPAIFWLDAHGGMLDKGADDYVFDPTGGRSQCPVVAELQAIGAFGHGPRSCVLIDDARCFLRPMPHLRAEEWPTLADLMKLLEGNGDRYITILDDVVIAVPTDLRPAVDDWWLQQVAERQGRDWRSQRLFDAYNPTPAVAARRLVKSLVPSSVRNRYSRRKWQQVR